MKQPLVRECVAWRVDPPTLGSRAWRGLLLTLWVLGLPLVLLAAVVSLFDWSGGGNNVDYVAPPRRRDPRMPVAGLMPLTRARVSGVAPALPPGGVERRKVSTGKASATVGVDRKTLDLPLHGLTPVAADCTSSSGSYAANAPWVVRVTGPGTDLTFTGTRLTLAWLAQLGGWPEPPRHLG